MQVQTHKKYIMYVHIQVQTHKKYIMSINTQSKMQNYDQNTQKCAIISLSMKEWMWWGRQRMCAQHRVSLSFRLITLIVARMVMMINMIMTRMMGMLTRMRIFSFRWVHPSVVDGCNDASTLPLIKDPGDELNEVNRNSPLWSRELSHIGFLGLGKVSYTSQGCTKILVLNLVW